MRRKTKRKLTLMASSAALCVCIGGLGFAAWQSYGKRTPDRLGCFTGVPQRHTLVLVDASEPRFDKAQARALRRYFRQLYDGLPFNARLSVFTNEGDQIASVMAPRFAVCAPARTPEQLTAIGAEAGSAAYVDAQRKRLYERVFAPELEALLSPRPGHARRQSHQSPILEQIAALSRRPEVGSGSRLVLVSDLIQNSESAHFCAEKNNMPPFAVFSQRPVYETRLRPASLDGVAVEVLMLQRSTYGPYCRNEEEIRAFWHDYLVASGAPDPRFTRIRLGRGE